jgi:hypothetical protein
MLTAYVKETDSSTQEHNMATIEDERRGINGTSPNVLFQALTIFVWIIGLGLLIGAAKYVREGHVSPFRLVIPVIHFVPWGIGILERRRIRAFLSLATHDQSLIQAAITRVLWTGYLALAFVEYWLYRTSI